DAIAERTVVTAATDDIFVQFQRGDFFGRIIYDESSPERLRFFQFIFVALGKKRQARRDLLRHFQSVHYLSLVKLPERESKSFELNTVSYKPTSSPSCLLIPV